MVDHSPTFDAFMKRLYNAACEDVLALKGFRKTVLQALFEPFFKEKTDPDFAAPTLYLQNEYSILGLDKMTIDEINELPIDYVSSTSFGWAIEAPNEKVFIRISSSQDYNSLIHEKNKFNPKTRARPPILVGVNDLRYDISEAVVIETHPYVQAMNKVKGISYGGKANLSHFNVELANFCGYNSVKHAADVEKNSDFGIRFFTKESGEWAAVPHKECKNVVQQESGYITDKGVSVIPVPYLFDTDQIKEADIDMNEQRAHLEDLLTNDSVLEQFRNSSLSLTAKRNIIECYLAFDAQNRVQATPT